MFPGPGQPRAAKATGQPVSSSRCRADGESRHARPGMTRLGNKMGVRHGAFSLAIPGRNASCACQPHWSCADDARLRPSARYARPHSGAATHLQRLGSPPGRSRAAAARHRRGSAGDERSSQQPAPSAPRQPFARPALSRRYSQSRSSRFAEIRNSVAATR